MGGDVAECLRAIARLPYRLLDSAPEGPVLCVDGALGVPGLELSHWPGNRTPPELKRDLSTEIALAFVEAGGAGSPDDLASLRAIVNNHYDTDGLCAAWVLLNPSRALELREPLVRTAASGDFFLVPDESAFARDLTIQAVADRTRSPIADRLEAVPESERLQVASEFVLAELGGWLESDLDGSALAGLRPCWEEELSRYRAGRTAIDRPGVARLAGKDLDLTLFDLGHVDGDEGLPGRHALFEVAGTDRVLVSAETDRGRLHRLVVGTRSWFDIGAERRPPARFDLARVAATLCEGEPARGGSSWRFDSGPHPSPELWFGTDVHKAFEEHHAGLAPSTTSVDDILAAIDLSA